MKAFSQGEEELNLINTRGLTGQLEEILYFFKFFIIIIIITIIIIVTWIPCTAVIFYKVGSVWPPFKVVQ